ncbi:glycosyltransferase family 2 protein, partial [Shimia sp.]|uniref:glycosyltransferase family 2 protein n=1 Tax=Shimia sp. TaxID=1954381 RepID=UPI003569FDC2
MSQSPVSVVIVSRGRPQALARCLTGLSQQTHPSFETIVVADPSGCAAVNDGAFSGLVKLVAFDEANISAARNLGIARAAGELVAFIDDDAVPEPTWLAHLVAPFDSDPEVMAAGGFVRGRNGISFQWT